MSLRETEEMSAEYILAILETDCRPVTGKQLHDRNSDYRFYPAKHSGEILTIDAMLWDESKRHTIKRKPLLSMWPSTQIVSECLNRSVVARNWVLIAVTQSNVAQTIDPDTSMTLSPLPELSKNFFEVGYDVVDISGLSALANIGYTTQDILQLALNPLRVTAHGLIADLQDAKKFAEFASNAAAEHAPFSPVRVLATAANEPKEQ